MKADNNLLYEIETGIPMIHVNKRISGLLNSRDLTIIRLYKQIENQEDYVFSKNIFLSKVIYENWFKENIKIIEEKWQTLRYKKQKFMIGLESVEEYMSKMDMDLDDQEILSKIRDHLVNLNESSKNNNLFFENSIIQMKRIIGSGRVLSDNDFNKITMNKFLDSDPEEELLDYILIEDEILEGLDREIRELDTSFMLPDSEYHDLIINFNKEETELYYKNIENFEILFKEYVLKKEERIKAMISSGVFKEESKEIKSGIKERTPTYKIIRTIENHTKVCSVCMEETSSNYCQNIECQTIIPEGTVYSSPDGKILDYFIENFKNILSPLGELNLLKITDKKISLSKYGTEYKEQLKYFLENTEHSFSLNHNNYNKLRTNIKEDIKKQEEIKTAIFDKGELTGKLVHFWEYYENDNYIYGIIQHMDEIKTPLLVKESKESPVNEHQTWDINITEKYYENRVVYVKTDHFGQILEVEEGILDINNSNKILLRVGLGEFSELVSLKPVSMRPTITDIMYVEEKITSFKEQEELKTKGLSLLNSYLKVNNIPDNIMKDKSESYRFSRRFTYSLSSGYFLYEKNNNIYKLSSEKRGFYKRGSIDKIEYYKVKEAIKYKNYKGWRKILNKTYFLNMISPNNGSEAFYNSYHKEMNEKTKEYLRLITEENSLLDLIRPNSDPRPIFINRNSITNHSDEKEREFDKSRLEVYSIKDVTPFFWKELMTYPSINSMRIEITNSQDEPSQAKLNIFEKPKEYYNPHISQFVPSDFGIKKDILNNKQFIQNGLKTMGSEDIFTVSMVLKLDQEITLYELTMLETYLEQNGLKVRKREEVILPFSIKTNDLICFLL